MDIIKRFHQTFGRWYDRLFDDSGGDALRPKDVLRKILDAMEEHRSEGIDGKVYVPNKYVLELAVADPDEHDYLLSFLDEEELAAVIKRYMDQISYLTGGPLDFTILDVDPDDTTEKLQVKVRFDKSDCPPKQALDGPHDYETEALDHSDQQLLFEDDEALTVASPRMTWAALVVTLPDGRRTVAAISKPDFTIGRSCQLGNDLVLSSDGQVSKRHARIEREPDGKATIYDLESTNGVILNSNLISGNALLKAGDDILIGTTKLVFQQDPP